MSRTPAPEMVLTLDISLSNGHPPPAQPGAAAGTIRFFGSQVGGESVINYSYTDMPLKLLMWDIRNFFVYIWFLPWVVWPLTPTDSGDFDELAFNRTNLRCIGIHIVLIFLQLGFILGLPFTILFPLWIDVIAIALFFVINWAICLLLNGDTTTMHSDPKYATAEDHPHEQWIFLNGVAVGEDWLTSNINRLALTFRRPVIGVHNRTSGIIFDVVECLIQRNFGYATSDVRIAYKIVKDKLYNPQYSKVVFILHSQGGIEGGLVLDWLLQELPQDLLAKLEVYTFGNAANHFNNPHLHVKSQAVQKRYGALSTSDTIKRQPQDTGPLLDSPTEVKSSSSRAGEGVDLGMTATNGDQNPAEPKSEEVPHVVPASDRVIGHVEHYAHTTDFVALWGVLHFATGQMANRQVPRFIGRVFSRSSPRGGHQFCQHYLDGMFPLEKDPNGGKNDFLGCAEDNEFMDSIIEEPPRPTTAPGPEPGPDHIRAAPPTGASPGTAESDPDPEPWDLREDIATSFGMLLQEANDEVQFLSGGGSFHEKTRNILPPGRPIRVKDLSRLWLYRNGKSPALDERRDRREFGKRVHTL